MPNEQSSLRKGVLSMTDCIMIAIGGMVGSSIFTLSGVTYAMAGPGAVLSWVIAGVILLLYALNVAELATIYPRSGGIYIYPSEVLGSNKTQKSFFGWLAAWSWLNVSILGTAFSAIFVSNYLSAVLPAVQDYQVLVAVLWIALVFLLNALGISFMGKINLVLTGSLVVVCLVYVFNGFSSVDMANFTPFIGQGAMGSSGVLAAIPVAMLAYGSIIAVASIAEEIKDPKRTIPRAMGISVVATVAMYSLILFVTYGLAPASEFIGNDFAAYAPLNYAIVRSLPGKEWLSTLVSIGALLAISTTMLILVMDAGRTIMATASSGLLPKALTKVNEKTQTPVNALALGAIVAAIVACFPQFTMDIVNTGSFCSGITVAILTITLMVNRKKGIKQEGSFVVPGGYTVPIVTLLVLAVTLTQLESMAYVLSAYWYLAGLVIFILAYFMRKDKIQKL